MELEVLNTALAKHIRPATFPLAIRMVAPDEAFPERTERPKSDLGERIAICQGSALARHCGWAVGMTTEDVSCPLALAVWGLKPMLGYFLEGMTCADMYTRTPAEGVVTEASVDKWEYGQWQGAVAAPLRRAAFDPHLVLLYGCSARVMRPVTARLWSSGGRSSSSFAGRIDCADAVIATMKTGECQVIPACYGDRGLARHLRKREPAARMRGLWCRACLFRPSTWSEEGAQLQRQVHIGLAVSLGEEGSIVPVLRNAEPKSLRRLATEVGDLACRARRDLHHHQPWRERVAFCHPDHLPAAICYPWGWRHSKAGGGSGRRDCHPADGLSVADFRPPFA
jgi:uncharacterized protein (DUF169 family)